MSSSRRYAQPHGEESRGWEPSKEESRGWEPSKEETDLSKRMFGQPRTLLSDFLVIPVKKKDEKMKNETVIGVKGKKGIGIPLPKTVHDEKVNPNASNYSHGKIRETKPSQTAIRKAIEAEKLMKHRKREVLDMNNLGKDVKMEEGESAAQADAMSRQSYVGMLDSKSFRWYCTQIVTSEIDKLVSGIISDLVRFQVRQKERDPKKFKKRVVFGLREVARSVDRAKAKCVVLVPNIEKSTVEGGLDDTVTRLLYSCRTLQIPVVFALTKNKLGKLKSGKKSYGYRSQISAVSILNPDGVLQEYKKMLEYAQNLQAEWIDKNGVEAYNAVIARLCDGGDDGMEGKKGEEEENGEEQKEKGGLEEKKEEEENEEEEESQTTKRGGRRSKKQRERDRKLMGEII